MFLTLRFAARSDVGLVRANNQDSAYAGPHLLVVADGMGGAAGGDIASSIAVGRLAALDGEALGPDEALDDLKDAIADAHAEIVERAHNDPELSGLGTTVTAILRSGTSLAMAHIGDSRCYLLRDGDLDQVTSDHTFVQHLVDTGRLSVADAENHPKRKCCCACSATSTPTCPSTSPCARPAWATAGCCAPTGCPAWSSRDTIHQTMLEVEDPADCADALVALALAAGAPDNVTCIIGDIVDIDADPGKAKPDAQPDRRVRRARPQAPLPRLSPRPRRGPPSCRRLAAEDDEEEDRGGALVATSAVAAAPRRAHRGGRGTVGRVRLVADAVLRRCATATTWPSTAASRRPSARSPSTT